MSKSTFLFEGGGSKNRFKDSFYIKCVSKFFSLACITFLTSCVSAPMLKITSNIPARIEKNGITICEQTPCEVNANYYTDGYGLGCVGSRQTPLEAFPLANIRGASRQHKVVEADCGDISNVFFDMNSIGVITTSPQSDK